VGEKMDEVMETDPAEEEYTEAAADAKEEATQESGEGGLAGAAPLSDDSKPEGAAPAATVETDGSSEQDRKLFLGGLSWDSTEVTLKEVFGKHGAIVDVVIMKDKMTGKSRGFGFITYATKEAADSANGQKLSIDGKDVEAKRAVSRESIGRRDGLPEKVTKVFIGGLASEATEAELTEVFGKFGAIGAPSLSPLLLCCTCSLLPCCALPPPPSRRYIHT
jgi:RNA recognition motif-containing protein